MMRVLITPPSIDLLSLSDCKAMLGITDPTRDTALVAAIKAVSGTIDPASGGWLGRALRPQTWELQLWGFPRADHVIELPFPPLIAVNSVLYADGDGVDQALVPDADYVVIQRGSGIAMIRPAAGKAWPRARWDTGSVRIRFSCGYAVIGEVDKMPPAIKSAVALGAKQLMELGIRDLFIAGESVDGVAATKYDVSPKVAAIVHQAVDQLLFNFRVYE